MRIRIGKFMSYLLRHDPMGLKISRDGFVAIPELLELMQKRYSWLTRDYLERVVRQDRKGRFEINLDRIRARYGHSLDVSPRFPLARVETLYHGTSEESAQKILKEGLTPICRKRVHLSTTIKDAIAVGRRRTENPVILKIDTSKAIKQGIRIEKATPKVYVSDYVPPELIERIKSV